MARTKAVLDAPAPVDPGLRAAGQPHLDAVLAAHPRTFDGRVMCLVRADPDGLVLAPGSYFDFLAPTCDAIRTVPALRDHPGPRAAALGCTALVRCPEGVLLARRPAALAIDPGRWHFLAAGAAEPGPGDPVERALRAELREEVGLTEARITRLGVGIDLERLRPELSAIADVDLPAPEVLAGVDAAEADEVLLQPWDRLHELRALPLAPAAWVSLLLLEDQGQP
jgi:8-oxo-dGTP pyrophosphatase MutT (NUDIX family)